MRTRFSVDIMKRNSQSILLTGFSWNKVINFEKAEDILNAIIEQIGPYVNKDGAVIRSDGAPAFQALKLARNREDMNEVLKGLNIPFELGHSQNVNKIPCAENVTKEGHIAINKLGSPHTWM